MNFGIVSRPKFGRFLLQPSVLQISADVAYHALCFDFITNLVIVRLRKKHKGSLAEGHHVVVPLVYLFSRYSHCTARWTTTIMSNERSPKGRITDKVARSFGKLSHLLRRSVSSSKNINLNSSSENYIAKTDAQYVYFNLECRMSLNRW